MADRKEGHALRRPSLKPTHPPTIVNPTLRRRVIDERTRRVRGHAVNLRDPSLRSRSGGSTSSTLRLEIAHEIVSRFCLNFVGCLPNTRRAALELQTAEQ
jgi:hypothetical protein